MSSLMIIITYNYHYYHFIIIGFAGHHENSGEVFVIKSSFKKFIMIQAKDWDASKKTDHLVEICTKLADVCTQLVEISTKWSVF